MVTDEPSMVTHTCNPSYLGSMREKDHNFKLSLDSLVRLSLKIKKKKIYREIEHSGLDTQYLPIKQHMNVYISIT